MAYQLKIERLQDEDPFPFGMYQGRPMRDVPATYLHWLWTRAERPLKWDAHSPVGKYIRASLGALKQEDADLIW